MKIFYKIILFFTCFFFLNPILSNDQNLKNLILKLDTKDFKKKILVIEEIYLNKSDFTLAALKNILNGNLTISGLPNGQTRENTFSGKRVGS